MLNFKPAVLLSSFTLIMRLFSFSSLSATRVVSSVYLRLLIFLPAILIPAYASSSPAFRMLYSASNDLVLCIRGPKYWSFSFNISPYYEYSGLISFRIDYFDLLAVQGAFPTRLLHPWNFPGKNTQMGCHFLLQGIFLTQGSNPCLLHW